MTGTLNTGRAVGRPLDRLDGAAKTTGAAHYAAEFPHPGLVHAALVHADIPRGRITAIHTADALARDGVLTVLTHLNAPPLKSPPKVSMLRMETMVSGTTINYLNTDEVSWSGQPVAVVVAETLDAALDAAAAVRVEYEQLPAVVDFEAARADAVMPPSSPMLTPESKKGDAEAALAAAARSVDMRFTTPRQNHNAIEPHATTAVWDGDRLTVHEAAQSVDWFRTHLAHRFDVPVSGVRVIAPYVGGGFGGKGSVWAGTILAALAARATGRPVRLALTRESVYRTVGGRAPSVQRVAIGSDLDGSFSALVHTGISAAARIGGTPDPVTQNSGHMYAADNILLRLEVATMDTLSNTFMRAPGEAMGSFALESAVDQLAHEIGIDPVALRMRNEPETGPLDGKAYSHRRLRENYTRGAELFGWARRTPEPGSMRDGRWLIGWGAASAYHPSFSLPANVTVRLAADGSVLVRCGFQEMGMGAATAQAQIAADALGVPVEAVRVEYGDSELPTGPMAGGSVQTASVAASLVRACRKLKRSVFTLAQRSGSSPLRGRKPDQVRARDSGLYPLDGSPGESYTAILERAGRPAVEAAFGSDTGIGRVAGQVRFMSKLLLDQRRWLKGASGAHFCEVRVDPVTGEVRVSRWVGAFDIGTVVNPKTATSQIRGGIVMGIGAALAEATLVDPGTGRIANPSLSEYHIPVNADIPKIEISFLDDPDPTMPLGILGAGEVGITGVAAAVANAVFHATGKRVCDLPITLDKLL